MKRILVENGANVNNQGYKGLTPIFYTMERENIDIIKYLLDNGAVKIYIIY